MNNNLVLMSRIHIRVKPLAISSLSPLNSQYARDHLCRYPPNNLNFDDRSRLNPRTQLLAVSPNRHGKSRSPYANQTQTIMASSAPFQKKVNVLNAEENQLRRKIPPFVKLLKDQSLSVTSTLKKSDHSTKSQATAIKIKASSFLGQSGSFRDEKIDEIKQFDSETDQNPKRNLQENGYRSHHVSPQAFPIRNQKKHMTAFYTTSHTPKELLKQKNLDFLKTIKLRKQLQKGQKKISNVSQQCIKKNQPKTPTARSSFNNLFQSIKRSGFYPIANGNHTLYKKETFLSNFPEQAQQNPVAVSKHIQRAKNKISIQDFQLLDKLGKGSIGEVFKARQIELGFMCVIKKISKKKVNELKLEQMVVRQIKLQSYLSNGHCTSIYGYFDDEQSVYLILELLPDASLQKVKKKRKLPEVEAIFIIHQVAEGLKYLHSQNVIHRDIKPENIFMYEDYIKIGDFGCSIYHNQDGLRNSVVGSLEYFSPEQLFNQGYTEKIDSWCLGILTYQILYGKSPFQREIKQILNGQQRQFFPQIYFPETPVIGAEAKDFIQSLLKKQPQQRMSMNEALAHPFLSDIQKE